MSGFPSGVRVHHALETHMRKSFNGLAAIAPRGLESGALIACCIRPAKNRAAHRSRITGLENLPVETTEIIPDLLTRLPATTDAQTIATLTPANIAAARRRKSDAA